MLEHKRRRGVEEEGVGIVLQESAAFTSAYLCVNSSHKKKKKECNCDLRNWFGGIWANRQWSGEKGSCLQTHSHRSSDNIPSLLPGKCLSFWQSRRGTVASLWPVLSFSDEHTNAAKAVNKLVQYREKPELRLFRGRFEKASDDTIPDLLFHIIVWKWKASNRALNSGWRCENLWAQNKTIAQLFWGNIANYFSTCKAWQADCVAVDGGIFRPGILIFCLATP